VRELQLLQQQINQAVAHALGDDSRQPHGIGGQIRLIGQESGILSLPDTPESAASSLILDATSPFFGFRRFLAGVSRFDGNDVVA
jgi:hypothetical protein